MHAGKSNFPLPKKSRRNPNTGEPYSLTPKEHLIYELLRIRGLIDESLKNPTWLADCTKDQLKLMLDQCRRGIGHQLFYEYKNLREYWEELKRPKAVKIMIPIEFKEKLEEYCKRNNSLISSPEELESYVVRHIYDAIRDWMKHHLKISGIEGV